MYKIFFFNFFFFFFFFFSIQDFMDKLEISFTEDEYKAFLSRTTVDEDGELNY
jgi:hypothetical protein